MGQCVEVVLLEEQKDFSMKDLVTDISEKEWLRSVATNPAFDFLSNADEDVYSLADGKSFSILSMSETEQLTYVRYQDDLRYQASLVVSNYGLGLREGREAGIVEGRVEGRVEGESKLLKRQLERRFGALPAWATEKLSSASEQTLDVWGEAVLTALTLEAVFKTDDIH